MLRSHIRPLLGLCSEKTQKLSYKLSVKQQPYRIFCKFSDRLGYLVRIEIRQLFYTWQFFVRQLLISSYDKFLQ